MNANERPPPSANGAELYPKPIRLYPSREERRLWFWIAAKSGLSPFAMAQRGAELYARQLIAERLRQGRKVPAEFLQMLKVES